MKALLARIEKLEQTAGVHDEKIECVIFRKYDASRPPQTIPLNFASCDGVTLERLIGEDEADFEQRAVEYFKKPKQIVMIMMDENIPKVG